MYRRYRAPLVSRIACDLRWYFRAFIRLVPKLVPEIICAACFMLTLLLGPVLAAFFIQG